MKTKFQVEYLCVYENSDDTYRNWRSFYSRRQASKFVRFLRKEGNKIISVERQFKKFQDNRVLDIKKF